MQEISTGNLPMQLPAIINGIVLVTGGVGCLRFSHSTFSLSEIR